MGEVGPELLKAPSFALSLSGSIWEHLEGEVWLLRVAELFSCDFETILHFADALLNSNQLILYITTYTVL